MGGIHLVLYEKTLSRGKDAIGQITIYSLHSAYPCPAIVSCGPGFFLRMYVSLRIIHIIRGRNAGQTQLVKGNRLAVVIAKQRPATGFGIHGWSNFSAIKRRSERNGFRKRLFLMGAIFSVVIYVH